MEFISALRRIPVYPSITLNAYGNPTVLGVSYMLWSDALEAKRANVEYITVDIFGQRVTDDEGNIINLPEPSRG